MGESNAGALRGGASPSEAWLPRSDGLEFHYLNERISQRRSTEHMETGTEKNEMSHVFRRTWNRDETDDAHLRDGRKQGEAKAFCSNGLACFKAGGTKCQICLYFVAILPTEVGSRDGPREERRNMESELSDLGSGSLRGTSLGWSHRSFDCDGHGEICRIERGSSSAP